MRGVRTEDGYIGDFGNAGCARYLDLGGAYMVDHFIKIHWTKTLRFMHFIVYMACFWYKSWLRAKYFKRVTPRIKIMMIVFLNINSLIENSSLPESSNLSFDVYYFIVVLNCFRSDSKGISVFNLWYF